MAVGDTWILLEVARQGIWVNGQSIGDIDIDMYTT